MLLAARMVLFAGLAPTPEDATRQVREALASGAGVEKWREIVEHQGGDPRTVDDYSLLPSVPDRHMVSADREGYLRVLDAELVGRATVALGAGRAKVDDAVDPAVGGARRAGLARGGSWRRGRSGGGRAAGGGRRACAPKLPAPGQERRREAEGGRWKAEGGGLGGRRTAWRL